MAIPAPPANPTSAAKPGNTDTVPVDKAPHPGAGPAHDAHDLVPGNDTGTVHLQILVDDMQVGAANPTCLHLQQYLTDPGLRDGSVAKFQDPRHGGRRPRPHSHHHVLLLLLPRHQSGATTSKTAGCLTRGTSPPAYFGFGPGHLWRRKRQAM